MSSVWRSGWQRRCWSRRRQAEVHHGAVGLIADHHAGDLRPLLVPHHRGGVPGQRRQVGLHGAAARHEAADGTLLAPVRDWLVLHLVITLVQVLILETPLVLNMNVDVKLSRLSLSQQFFTLNVSETFGDVQRRLSCVICDGH